jgi:hypothetical protein
MFEAPKEDKELGLHKAWIAAFVVIVAIVLLVGYKVLNKGSAKQSAPTAAQLTDADAVKDLRVESVVMQKDSMGTTAVWLVRLVNNSDKFTYTDIAYQTDYMGGNNNLILQNRGTIAMTIAPNGENSAEVRDAAYPTGVAWYKFKVTGATAKIVE